MDILVVFRKELIKLWGGGKGVSLIAIATGWGLLNGGRMIFPIIIPYLQTTYGLSLTISGLLMTVLWFFSAIGQLPSGMLADKYNERTLMTISTIVVGAAIGLVVTSSSLIILFLATMTWGIGHSLYPIARITFLSDLYSNRIGSALGVTMAVGDVGQTVLPPVAATFAAAIAWQVGLGFVAPLLILAAIFIFVTSASQNSRETSTSTQSTWAPPDVFIELRKPVIGFMTGILFLYIFIWQSFTAFYPTYLTTVKGLSTQVASILFGFFFAVGVFVKPITGAVYDRIGMRGSLLGILTPATVGLFLLPFIDNLFLLVGITALISTMLGTGTVTQSFLAESFSNEMKGTGLGVIRTLTASLAAGGPFLFGVIGDYGYFDEGYIILAVIMFIAIALSVWIPEEG